MGRDLLDPFEALGMLWVCWEVCLWPALLEQHIGRAVTGVCPRPYHPLQAHMPTICPLPTCTHVLLHGHLFKPKCGHLECTPPCFHTLLHTQASTRA